jgi:hypothetical protein
MARYRPVPVPGPAAVHRRRHRLHRLRVHPRRGTGGAPSAGRRTRNADPVLPHRRRGAGVRSRGPDPHGAGQRLVDGGSPEDAYEDAVAEIDRLVSLLEQPIQERPVLPRRRPGTAVRLEPDRRRNSRPTSPGRRITSPRATSSRSSARSGSAPRSRRRPLDVYRAVRSVNPSPYMFLLELEGFALVGASPEIHVRCEDREVEIRPIAGTRQRGKTPEEDLAWKRNCSPIPRNAPNT